MGFLRGLRFTAFSALLLAVLSASAASRVDCSSMPSKILGRPVPYCVMLPPSYDEKQPTPARRYPVLYYLHGLGDNEQSLVNAGGWQVYEQLLEDKKVGEYIIVTPYGFRSFYINSRDGKFAYEDFFLKEFMPAIERKYRVKAGRTSRGIMGISMGGYGAFHYAFKYPQLFGSMSAHMAALMENPPENLGKSREGKLLAEIFGDPLDRAYYKRNSPFTYARTQPAATLNRVPIYFDVGANDGFGFDSGNRAMDALLTSRRKVKHEFHVYPGGHDWNFVIQHFGASLEWHSKAFEK
jgi:S-formylglutathione hydrolase FrmB